MLVVLSGSIFHWATHDKAASIQLLLTSIATALHQFNQVIKVNGLHFQWQHIASDWIILTANVPCSLAEITQFRWIVGPWKLFPADTIVERGIFHAIVIHRAWFIQSQMRNLSTIFPLWNNTKNNNQLTACTTYSWPDKNTEMLSMKTSRK